MKVHYRLSDEAVKKAFIESGETLSPNQVADVEASRLTPELRATIAKFTKEFSVLYANGTEFATLLDEANAENLLRWHFEETRRREAEKLDRFVDEAIQSYENNNPESALPVLNERLLSRSPRYGEVLAAYERAKERRDAHLERLKLEREQREAERAAWIAEHGSPALRRRAAAGYDCQRRYVFERAALEYPGFLVDYADNAAWKSRSDPSDAALDEAERVGGRVVWLTRLPRVDEEEDEYFGETEAVVVEGFLGKYDLIKIF